MSNFPGGPFYYQFEGIRKLPTIDFHEYGYHYDPTKSGQYNFNRQRVSQKERVSMSCSFDDTVLTLGRPDRANEVHIYEYTYITNTWSSPIVLSNPGTSTSRFGYSVSLNWDANRLVVGSPGDNKIYVYDKNPTTGVWSFNSNVITGSTTVGVNFGEDVSIAQSTSDTIGVGAPGAANGGSRIYIYELINNTWTQTFSNTSVDVAALVPINASSNLIVNNNLSRYGHSVSVSYDGEHIIAGAPGTSNIWQFDSTNSNLPSGTIYNNKIDQTYNYSGFTYTTNYDIPQANMPLSVFSPNGMPGWVRVFTRGNATTWQGNAFQLGQTIRGENRWTLQERPNGAGDNRGFGWARCGWDVDIAKKSQTQPYNRELRLALASPGQPSINRNTSYSSQTGFVETYSYETETNTWVREAVINGDQIRDEFGNCIALDYTGNRIAISTMGQLEGTHFLGPGFRLETKKVSVLEWNGTSWWEATPTIYLNGASYPSTAVNGVVSYDNVQVTLTSGKDIFVSSPQYGNVYAQHVTLTSQFLGNSLFEGYIAADRLYIGSNDAAQNTDKTKGTKTIEFGGFFGDAAYELTAIENRVYVPTFDNDPGAVSGRGELLISKLSGGPGVDAIRVMSGEIIFGSSTLGSGSVVVRKDSIPGHTASINWTGNNSWYDVFEFNKYDRLTTTFGLDNRRNIVIHPNLKRPTRLYSNGAYNVNIDPNYYTDPGSFYGRAGLDVNSDCFVASRLMVSGIDGVQTQGYGREPPTLGFDTRNYDILQVDTGGPDRVNMIPLKLTRGDSQTRFESGYGTLHLNAFLDKNEKSFYFGTNGAGYVDCIQRVGSNNSGQRTGISFWIKMNNVSTAAGIIWQNDHTEFSFNSNGFTVRFNWRSVSLNPSGTYTNSWAGQPNYVNGTWYHVVLSMPGGSSAFHGGDPTSTNTQLWVNNVQMGNHTNVVSTGEPRSFWGSHARFRIGHESNAIRNSYIGMLKVYIGFIVKNQSPTVQDLYNDGAPSHVLNVSGDINLSGNIFQNGTLFSGGGGGGFDPNTTFVKLGLGAGETGQASFATAVGHRAGRTNQGQNTVAVGNLAGESSQVSQAVAVGFRAGRTNQSQYALAIGRSAGESSQATQAVAVGYLAGETNQGSSTVAIGVAAGRSGQGSFAIALGANAGQTNQPPSTFYVRRNSVRGDTNNHPVLKILSNGEIVAGPPSTVSDDRLKFAEKNITRAVQSIFKLRPQEYLKRSDLETYPNNIHEWVYESGLMAQEVFYDAPEFRHAVYIPKFAGDIETYTPPPSDDPTRDPDYSVWGSEPAGVHYEQFIPYLIKAVQEIVTELPRSKTTVSDTWGQNMYGRIVSANTNTHKSGATPIVTCSTVAKDKAWYGIVSDKRPDTNDYDTLVDTKGDTFIWVVNTGGVLESGDFITSSGTVPGYGEKQEDDLVHSYTVAKVTQACDFTEPMQRAVKVQKREVKDVTYYTRTIRRKIEIDEYELYGTRFTESETEPIYIYETDYEIGGEYIVQERFYYKGVEISHGKYENLPANDTDKTKTSRVEITPDEYIALSETEKKKFIPGTRDLYTHISKTSSTIRIPEHDKEEVISELVDVLDENGQIVWEETSDTEPAYTLVDHGSYKAALVSCTIL
jgi:hypothetical protein